MPAGVVLMSTSGEKVISWQSSAAEAGPLPLTSPLPPRTLFPSVPGSLSPPLAPLAPETAAFNDGGFISGTSWNMTSGRGGADS